MVSPSTCHIGRTRHFRRGPGSETQPEDGTSDEYKIYLEKVRKARAIIIMALDNKPLRAMQTDKGPKEMWIKLQDRYATCTTANKIGVMSTLMNTCHEEASDMGGYVAKLETLFTRLNSTGSPV